MFDVFIRESETGATRFKEAATFRGALVLP